jgi:hypothetical protein
MMEVSFIQGEGRTPSVSEDELNWSFPVVKEVTVLLGDGYVLTVKEENGNQNIDMLYPDGQSLRFESINK